MSSILSRLTILGLLTGLFLQATDFNFQDPKGVNSVGILLDSVHEPIQGYASGVSGTLSFDPGKPDALSGKIIVDAKSIKLTHEGMTGHMHGSRWMDTGKFPTISYEVTSVDSAEKLGDNSWKLMTKGTFNCRGVDKTISMPMTVSFLKDKAGARMSKTNGDLLVVRSDFTINRVDFGINPSAGADKVAHEVELTLAIVGLHRH